MGCCGMTPELSSAAWLGPSPGSTRRGSQLPRAKAPGRPPRVRGQELRARPQPQLPVRPSICPLGSHQGPSLPGLAKLPQAAHPPRLPPQTVSPTPTAAPRTKPWAGLKGLGHRHRASQPPAQWAEGGVWAGRSEGRGMEEPAGAEHR